LQHCIIICRICLSTSQGRKNKENGRRGRRRIKKRRRTRRRKRRGKKKKTTTHFIEIFRVLSRLPESVGTISRSG
jgi:Na+/phosphate symporter